MPALARRHSRKYSVDQKWKARSMWMNFINFEDIAVELGVPLETLKSWKKTCEPDGTDWELERQRVSDMALTRRVETQSENFARFGIEAHAIAEGFLSKLKTAVDLWGQSVNVIEQDGRRVAWAELDGEMEFEKLINPPPTLIKSFEVLSQYARLINNQTTENVGLQGLGKLLKQASDEITYYIEEESD